ncbi:GlsB/YeaQ/YmgE family stress response membrane protein [Corynebacterium macginleyi]|uniref:GlsB/YeaQ/YmgE family stress response membrane protein n=1 Tax=Corynebacterium macginleyi TaxID=38290 RepID=UPI00190C05B4|nr:GlsB/YeaQ/YmgE family stress response membrane protein [Corynebacterium macginleyi]MBK4139157.1 GlsB/YeaQ/YmgE family stress response membrane protein [Corynebacterium macginleyi]MBK4164332.1 GlsB/YeaQ/YmgE family stress response membrane protein [Corynebacterium macginleyi]QRJ59968.1 GlsB/YeaQ/YmgE family stress response membrane protein [Corynebacterium macginleyi]
MGLGLGLFTSIFVGIIAGWLAEKIMKRDHGLFTNLVVGVVGGLIGGITIQLLNIEASGGWIFSIFAATAGACLLLWIVDKVKK